MATRAMDVARKIERARQNEITLQRVRIKTTVMLTSFSIIEGIVIATAHTYDLPSALVVICAVCIFFNIPIIIMEIVRCIKRKNIERKRREQYNRLHRTGKPWVR